MRKKILDLVSIISISLLVIAALFPIFYILSHSLKAEADLAKLYDDTKQIAIMEKTFIKPFCINLEQYYSILLKAPEFLYYFWNSIMIVVPIVVFQLLIAVLAAYGFSKLKFKGSHFLFFVYIVLMLMPFQVTLVPNYLVLYELNLLDQHLGLILPGVFGTFGVFFLKQFMEGISDTFIEEARLCGAGELYILFKVIVPMCKPIIASTAVLLFVDYWNMVEQPLVFLSTRDKCPLSVYLADIATSNITIGFACSIIYMILPLMIVRAVNEDIREGMIITNLK